MKIKSWLDQFADHLTRAGLPPGYVDRSIGELADHWDQCEQYDPEFDQKLVASEPKQMAQFLTVSFRQAKWYRRIPAWLWIIASFPMGFVVSLAYYCTGLLAMGVATGGLGNHRERGVEAWFLPWMSDSGKLVTPIIAVFLLQKVFADLGRPRWVTTTATIMLAAGFLITSSDFQIPIGTQSGGFHLSFSNDTLANPWLVAGSTLQSITVLIATIVYRRRQPSGHLVREE